MKFSSDHNILNQSNIGIKNLISFTNVHGITKKSEEDDAGDSYLLKNL